MKLQDYRHYFSLRYDQFLAQHTLSESQIDHDVRYEKITDVTHVELFGDQHFYFKHGDLKMIYLSDDVLVNQLWKEFKSMQDTEKPDASVRSRAGKTSNMYVFAGQGITASIHGDTVDFIEIYPPQSLQEYLTNIYREPGLFIR